jgi:hypothetical protein
MAAELWKGVLGYKLRTDSVELKLSEQEVIAISKNIIELLGVNIECVPDDVQLWLEGKRQCVSCEGDGKFEGVPTPNGHSICYECNGEGSVKI